MQNKKRTSTGVLVMAVLFTVFQMVGVVFATMEIGVDITWMIQSLLMAVLCFAMYFTYRAHMKNVMKPLLGASLMLLLSNELQTGGLYLQYSRQVAEWYTTNTAWALFATAQILALLVILGINLMHYIINSNHMSSPGRVRLNRWLCAAFVLLVLIQGFLILNFVETFAGKLGCLRAPCPISLWLAL